jgi:hypothetical protein
MSTFRSDGAGDVNRESDAESCDWLNSNKGTYCPIGMSSIACGPGHSVNSADPTATTRLVGQFWGLDSDRVFEFFLRQIVFSQKVDALPGGRRPMGHRL